MITIIKSLLIKIIHGSDYNDNRSNDDAIDDAIDDADGDYTDYYCCYDYNDDL